MTANKPLHLVPKLRFPEFDAAPAWQEHSLGDVCEMKAGDFVRASEIFDTQRDGLFPCYGGNGLRGFVRTYTHRGLYVLVGRQGALCGNVNLFDGCFHATEHALVATPSSGIDTHWLYYALDILKLNRFTTGQAQPGLSVTTLNAIPLAVPVDRDEQRKIAACLGSLDDVIAAEGRKLEFLRQYEQGLMQQLLPRPGETVPRLRLPEFLVAREWGVRNLENLVHIQSGGTPSKANPAFWEGSIPWVSAKDMKRLFLEDTEDHISTAAVDDGVRVVPAGTLLMLTRGMTLLKDVPICVLGRDMSFNQDVKGLRPKKGVNGLFLAFALLANKQRLLKMVDVAGHGTGKLNTDELEAFELAFPQPAEQQRIAACISSLDNVLAAQSRKVKALTAHKQGLSQQLFPSVEAE
jgi:restriction endonuclease S subunit